MAQIPSEFLEKHIFSVSCGVFIFFKGKFKPNLNIIKMCTNILRHTAKFAYIHMLGIRNSLIPLIMDNLIKVFGINI